MFFLTYFTSAASTCGFEMSNLQTIIAPIIFLNYIILISKQIMEVLTLINRLISLAIYTIISKRIMC